MKTLEASATTSASPSAVWALLADVSEWPRWGTWSRVEIEGGGAHVPGAIRVLIRWPFRVRERVTDWIVNERMGYEIVSGMNVRGYHATVTLEPGPGGGTTVRWSSRYESADPLTALVLALAVRDTCKRVAKAASA